MSVTRAIRILEAWGANPIDVCHILGLNSVNVGGGHGSSVSATSPSTQKRAQLVESMDKHLRVLLPQSHAEWARMRNEAPLFAGATPMSILMTGQISQIRRVERWLAGWASG
jgi:hypothetical protein